MSSIGNHKNYDQVSLFTVEPENILQDREQEEFLSIHHKHYEKIIRLLESQKKMDMIYNYKIKNQIKVYKDNEVKEEKVRKTRKDKEGRKFICGECKLGYLSYPALYTHIKTKHQGETPEGTIRGESGKPKKRGRPKVRKTPQIYERELEKCEFPKELSNLLGKEQLDLMEFDVEAGEDEQVEITLKYYVGLVREIKKMVNPKLKLFPVNKVITTFLQNLKNHINEETMQFAEELFYDWMKFMDQHYFKILTDYQAQSKYYVNRFLQPGEVYSQVESPYFLPVFAESFIKVWLIGENQINSTVILDFCHWLHSSKLTDLKLSRKKQFTLNTSIDVVE